MSYKIKDEEINDEFPYEFLMSIKTDEEKSPWFADFTNYLVGGILRKGLTNAQRCKFFSELKHYFWDEPYLFKAYPDGMIRRCVHGSETQKILDECHHRPTRGHYESSITAKKVLMLDSIGQPYSKKHRLCEIFDIWGIDFMGPFLKSYKFEYILVAIDYVSKWAEVEALPTNDARVVVNFLKKLFSCFEILKALISDRRTHFCNRQMEKILKKYGVHHRIATTYHPQTSGQVENTNRALKRILEKTVKDNPSVWLIKLDDALWAFRTAYKTPIGTTLYRFVYGKTCHLPFEIEHHAYWALRSCNPDLKIAGEKRFLQLHELDELRLQAYENSKLYKARTKAYHDKKLRVRKEFKAGDKVLLYNSKYKFKAPKLRSKWYGLHRVKLYHDEEQLNELTTEEIHLMCEEGRMKAIPFMASFPANYRETMPWALEKPYIYSVVENTCNKAKLSDLDETGKRIMIENILFLQEMTHLAAQVLPQCMDTWFLSYFPISVFAHFAALRAMLNENKKTRERTCRDYLNIRMPVSYQERKHLQSQAQLEQGTLNKVVVKSPTKDSTKATSSAALPESPAARQKHVLPGRRRFAQL
ncbi:reverse transcriptase domain-containing protein [Tanacetum coccineum]